MLKGWAASAACPAGATNDVDDYGRDYATKTAQDVWMKIERLCTPSGDVLDAVLLDGILTNTRRIVLDGAVLKDEH